MEKAVGARGSPGGGPARRGGGRAGQPGGSIAQVGGDGGGQWGADFVRGAGEKGDGKGGIAKDPPHTHPHPLHTPAHFPHSTASHVRPPIPFINPLIPISTPHPAPRSLSSVGLTSPQFSGQGPWGALLLPSQCSQCHPATGNAQGPSFKTSSPTATSSSKSQARGQTSVFQTLIFFFPFPSGSGPVCSVSLPRAGAEAWAAQFGVMVTPGSHGPVSVLGAGAGSAGSHRAPHGPVTRPTPQDLGPPVPPDWLWLLQQAPVLDQSSPGLFCSCFALSSLLAPLHPSTSEPFRLFPRAGVWLCRAGGSTALGMFECKMMGAGLAIQELGLEERGLNNRQGEESKYLGCEVMFYASICCFPVCATQTVAFN